MAAGDVVNTAARLQSAAPVNGVLVGEATYRATRQVIDYREAEPVEAKGKSEPIRVWEAVEARVALRQRPPAVTLTARRARARARPAPRRAGPRAAPARAAARDTRRRARGSESRGSCKSSSVAVEAEPDFTTWRQGRSLPYGEGISFWALAEIVKAQAGILESDAEEEAATKLEAAVRRSLPRSGRGRLDGRAHAEPARARRPRTTSRASERELLRLAWVPRGARGASGRSCSSSRTCTGPTTGCSISSTSS